MSGTFVTVGNATQPFPRLLEAVAMVADALPRPVLVQRGHTPFFGGGEGVETVDFVPMNRFSELVAQAEMLVMHAGAGSVIQAVRSGRAPIVMPRRAALGEHVNDHQVEFVRVLEAAGRVIVVEDAASLRKALEMKHDVAPAVSGEPPMVGLIRRILDEQKKLRGTI